MDKIVVYILYKFYCMYFCIFLASLLIILYWFLDFLYRVLRRMCSAL